MDFQIEFDEYIKMKYITSLEIFETINTMTKVKIVTLEGEELNLECDIYKGINVIKYNQVYENMEQILGQYSQLYVQKFYNDLNNKLKLLEQEQNEEN